MGDELVDDGVEEGEVGPAPDGEVDVALLGHRGSPRVDDHQGGPVGAVKAVEHPRPQHRLGEGHVVADEEEGVAVVDVGVGAGLTVGSEGLLHALGRGGGAEPGVAVQVDGAQARPGEHAEGVVLLEEELPGVVDADRPRPRVGKDLFVRPAKISRAVAQSTGRSSPFSRNRGEVRRSGWPFACQPNSPLGPRRPRFTRSSSRPRTPTMRPSLTPMSRAQPLEHRTHADCTHPSMSSGLVPCSRATPARAGHASPRPNGVRGPHGSTIRSLTTRAFPTGPVGKRSNCTRRGRGDRRLLEQTA